AVARECAPGASTPPPAGWDAPAAFRNAAGMLKDRRGTVGLDRQATYEMSDLNGDLVWALQQLPPQQRAAVVLFYYADHPIREIAAILDASLVAVRVNLSRGRKRLREILESNHA